MNVLEQLNSVFGRVTRLVGEHDPVAVHLWINSHGDGVVCTAGMSNRAQIVVPGRSCPSREPRTELMAFCRIPDAEMIGNLLLDLAEYPFRENRHLFWWQTIPLGRPLFPGSTIEGVLLSIPPLSADQFTFQIGEHRIDILWVVPILASELAEGQRHGIQALEKRLERDNIDITDLRRSIGDKGD